MRQNGTLSTSRVARLIPLNGSSRAVTARTIPPVTGSTAGMRPKEMTQAAISLAAGLMPSSQDRTPGCPLPGAARPAGAEVRFTGSPPSRCALSP